MTGERIWIGKKNDFFFVGKKSVWMVFQLNRSEPIAPNCPCTISRSLASFIISTVLVRIVCFATGTHPLYIYRMNKQTIINICNIFNFQYQMLISIAIKLIWLFHFYFVNFRIAFDKEKKIRIFILLRPTLNINYIIFKYIQTVTISH